MNKMDGIVIGLVDYAFASELEKNSDNAFWLLDYIMAACGSEYSNPIHNITPDNFVQLRSESVVMGQFFTLYKNK